MATPVVAIVGRTNVGKSMLFNRLARERKAVVEDQPGVTRDRLYARVELGLRPVLLIDTGGLAGGEDDELWRSVERHALLALEEADVLIVMVDGQTGVTGLDHDIADLVRRSRKPYVLVANKMESPAADSGDCAELGLGLPLDISSLHGTGVYDLADAVVEFLPPEEEPPEEEDAIRIAIVGRPNVGKSSLLNALVGEERVIVSEEPGTTRDAVDTAIERDGERFVLVDTAGLRKKARVSAATEYYSNLRALKAIDQATVVFIMLDASEGVTEQDQRIAGYADEAGRGAVLVANKWDRVRDLARQSAEEGGEAPELTPRQKRVLRKDFERVVRWRLSFMNYASLAFCSATEGWGVAELLPEAEAVASEFTRRIATGELNRALMAAMDQHHPPSHKGRQLKIYYATQVSVRPPTIVLFVNNPGLMHWSYERYLVRQFRERFGFRGTPMRLFVRARPRDPDRQPGSGRRSRKKQESVAPERPPEAGEQRP